LSNATVHDLFKCSCIEEAVKVNNNFAVDAKVMLYWLQKK